MAMAAHFQLITSQRSGDVYYFFVYLTLGLYHTTFVYTI